MKEQFLHLRHWFQFHYILIRHPQSCNLWNFTDFFRIYTMSFQIYASLSSTFTGINSWNAIDGKGIIFWITLGIVFVLWYEIRKNGNAFDVGFHLAAHWVVLPWLFLYQPNVYHLIILGTQTIIEITVYHILLIEQSLFRVPKFCN